jgi:hypothetical protein
LKKAKKAKRQKMPKISRVYQEEEFSRGVLKKWAKRQNFAYFIQRETK